MAKELFRTSAIDPIKTKSQALLLTSKEWRLQSCCNHL